MGRLIFVADHGDDLEGDGTAAHPFRSEERAEMDGEEGDYIAVFEDGLIYPPGRRPGRTVNWGRRVFIATSFVVTLYAFGRMFAHNPTLALLVGGAGAILAVAVLDH